MDQLPLTAQEQPRIALEAPRFKGWYRYTCFEIGCNGHRQQILDWEFVALQRKLIGCSDGRIKSELQRAFLDQMCRPDRDTAFYVGNQAKRAHTFSTLGTYYPPRQAPYPAGDGNNISSST